MSKSEIFSVRIRADQKALIGSVCRRRFVQESDADAGTGWKPSGEQPVRDSRLLAEEGKHQVHLDDLSSFVGQVRPPAYRSPVPAASQAVEVGSGNVFADLGFPDATELDIKVLLAIEIGRLVNDACTRGTRWFPA
jgi:hypothetical protein